MNWKRTLGLDNLSEEYAFARNDSTGYTSAKKIPDTWVPTVTCVTGLTAPVADSADCKAPRSILPVRYCTASPPLRCDHHPPPTATTARTTTPATTNDFFMRLL